MKQNFGELYRKLYDENKAELEQLRLKSKEETKKIIGYVLGFFALFIILGITGTGVFLIPVIFIFAIIAMIKGASASKIKESPTYKYRTLFKEKIIVPLITNVFEGATYNPDAGWTPAQYKEAGYRDWIDRYSSEDLIIAPMKLKDGVETKMEFCRKISKMPERVDLTTADGKTIILSHAGCDPWVTDEWARLWGIKDRYIWDRKHIHSSPMDFKEDEWKNTYVIHGHTPVLCSEFCGDPDVTLPGHEKVKAITYADGHKICLDLCTIITKEAVLFNLDTFEEIYFTEEGIREE